MTELLQAARGIVDETIALRRRIYRHPEVGLQLPRTQQAVLEALNRIEGLSVTTGTSVTSVVATLDGDHAGPTILLRADMDALPMPDESGVEFKSEVDGVMHACGHDAHTAMLVGAARLLAERRSQIAGRVLFMFQPGEEGYQGARYMIEEGLLDGERPPSAAFAIHQNTVFPSGMVRGAAGPASASADRLEILVRGVGGHASSPQNGIDPIPIACEIVLAIQSMVARTVGAFDQCVVSISKIDAGTAANVMPETARLLGTVRATSDRTRRQVWDRLRRLADGIAAAHGATAETTVTAGTPPMVNDPAATARVLEVAQRLGVAADGNGARIMGAEDFSYVLDRVPGTMVWLGTRPRDAQGPPVMPHSSRMVMDEEAMAVGVALHTAVALDYCATDPETRPLSGAAAV